MATGLSELLIDQSDQGRLIERFWTNLMKLGQNKITVPVLEQRKTLLENYWNSFRDTHRKILRCKESASSDYVKLSTYDVIEEAYLQAISRIAGALTSATPATSDAGSRNQQQTSVPLNIELPRVELPVFSGDSLQWESFRVLFRSIIHDNPNLTDSRRLLYLKSCLKGEAAAAILNTPVSDAAYSEAWTSIETRYGNKRLLSFSHFRNLLSCPPAKRSSSQELKRLLDVFRQSMLAFTALGKPVEQWDEWFVYLLVQKLDNSTHMDWETSLTDSTVVPPFKALAVFLENRIHALEAQMHVVDSPTCSDPSARSKFMRGPHVREVQNPAFRKERISTFSTSTDVRTKPKRSCLLCAGNHSLGFCAKFKKNAPLQRKELANKFGLCVNCLSPGHLVNSCYLKTNCLICDSRHHTLLHESLPNRITQGHHTLQHDSPPIRNIQSPPGIPLPSNPVTKHEDNLTSEKPRFLRASTSASLDNAQTYALQTRNVVLLATAQIMLVSPQGKTTLVRALLDTASDCSLVSDWVVQALGLPTRPVHIEVSGVTDSSAGVARKAANFTVRSSYDPNFALPLSAIVLPKLSAKMPHRSVSLGNWHHLTGLFLADPAFANPARIDVILGADVCGSLFLNETREGPPGTPIAKLSPFGWVLMGPTSPAERFSTQEAATTCLCVTQDPISTQLQRFWEIEEVSSQKPLSEEDALCESHFRSTHYRDESGRYVVRLPFKTEQESRKLAASRSPAEKRWLSCERRLSTNPNLKSKYDDFMLEYLKLGHMEVMSQDTSPCFGYYLPHHAVLKPHDPSGKIRVVFNASFITFSGLSLNDCLLTGPKLQSDLWMILTRWRFFRIAFITDIVKMFRQIRINKLDSRWQKLLWRLLPSDTLQEFQLTTVTYGTAPAPYLALRVLAQLAQDERHRFPLGAEAIEENSYVDDILSGADSLAQAMDKKDQLTDILLAGGFPLSKWSANAPELCPSSGSSNDRTFEEDATCNTLGLTWSPKDDSFSLRVSLINQSGIRTTKRSVLSEIARFFDPLGWISPVLIFAKVLMQDIWMLGLDWDLDLPDDLVRAWHLFRSSLPDLERLKVPRWVSYTTSNTIKTELHGFCDASERAYAAAVYLRVIDKSGSINVNLLVAKTKVAPIKTVSIPRLELCGAVLLCRLIATLVSGLKLPTASIRAWTDSEVTLAWIRGHASKWKPFVSHRVAEIQTILPPAHWAYVSTLQNPADVATRTISPLELIECEVWWKGAPWLREHEENWPTTTPKTNDAELSELKRTATCLVAQQKEDFDLFDKFSTLFRLVRITALCFRFSFNLKNRHGRRTGFLTAAELNAALKALVGLAQRTDFQTECSALTSGSNLLRSSPLLALRPFVDEDGLIRVGGRLHQSLLSMDEKHPLIIGKKNPLATLIVREAHRSTLHGGPQLTQSYLLRKFWIVRSRNLVRAVIRNCVRCARFSGRVATQLMGQLPPERIRPSRPFLHSGVDYAGPIMLRTTKGRGHRAYKGYICLFICLSTRAIHLELVSDLTCNTFLAAFRRFVSRRGRCSSLKSDNGTNFRGADRELRSMFKAASLFYKGVATSLASDGTSWDFIPPHAPHFGGLWEAGVKSVKHHLRRIVGDTTLTFEEMSTFLCQVEACLNSRPLCPISSDPSDLLPLTPGHFLVGESMTAIPEPSSFDDAIPLTSRWKLLTNMRDHFWRRWSSEYLHSVQQLAKWRTQHKDLETGMLVLIKDDLRPPTKWALGRITQVHRGPDGLIRVVSLRTATSTFTRPISKICPLPVPVTREG